MVTFPEIVIRFYASIFPIESLTIGGVGFLATVDMSYRLSSELSGYLE